MTTTTNYRMIYENDISQTTKDSLEMPRLYSDLSHSMRLFVEHSVDAGMKLATDQALNPEILHDTSDLASEMAAQLYSFANLINGHLRQDCDST